jgi:hypothetical protein
LVPERKVRSLATKASKSLVLFNSGYFGFQAWIVPLSIFWGTLDSKPDWCHTSNLWLWSSGEAISEEPDAWSMFDLYCSERMDLQGCPCKQTCWAPAPKANSACLL